MKAGAMAKSASTRRRQPSAAAETIVSLRGLRLSSLRLFVYAVCFIAFRVVRIAARGSLPLRGWRYGGVADSLFAVFSA